LENFSGLLGALIALFLERALTWRDDRNKEKKDAHNTYVFLQGWFNEIVRVLGEAADAYNAAIDDWKQYLSRAEEESDALVFPWLSYRRITMPDIEEVVIRKAAYMSEATYAGLLLLNRTVLLLDDRGKELADVWFGTAIGDLNREVRIRFAKTILDYLQSTRDVVTKGQGEAARIDLRKDFSQIRIGGAVWPLR
jgi:hypothetical protein